MTGAANKVLLIGFGNPGRLDDGLGPALAERFEKSRKRGLTVDSNYQLVVEDAYNVSKHKKVIFADASVNCKEPFSFKKIRPAKDISFSSHDISPRSVLGLAEHMFGSGAQGFLLEIRGYKFNKFGQRLSKKAKDNLDKAENFLKDYIENTLREEK
jgi:hydrogenase maturation protease